MDNNNISEIPGVPHWDPKNFRPKLKTPTLQFGGDGRPGKLFKLQLVAVTGSLLL
jgi:hypothetical protein